MTDISTHEGGEMVGVFVKFGNHDVRLPVGEVNGFLDPTKKDATLSLGLDAEGHDIGTMAKADENTVPNSIKRASTLVIGPLLETDPGQTAILKLHKRGLAAKLFDALSKREGLVKGHVTVVPTSLGTAS